MDGGYVMGLVRMEGRLVYYGFINTYHTLFLLFSQYI